MTELPGFFQSKRGKESTPSKEVVIAGDAIQYLGGERGENPSSAEITVGGDTLIELSATTRVVIQRTEPGSTNPSHGVVALEKRIHGDEWVRVPKNILTNDMDDDQLEKEKSDTRVLLGANEQKLAFARGEGTHLLPKGWQHHLDGDAIISSSIKGGVAERGVTLTFGAAALKSPAELEHRTNNPLAPEYTEKSVSVGSGRLKIDVATSNPVRVVHLKPNPHTSQP